MHPRWMKILPIVISNIILLSTTTQTLAGLPHHKQIQNQQNPAVTLIPDLKTQRKVQKLLPVEVQFIRITTHNLDLDPSYIPFGFYAMMRTRSSQNISNIRYQLKVQEPGVIRLLIDALRHAQMLQPTTPPVSQYMRVLGPKFELGLKSVGRHPSRTIPILINYFNDGPEFRKALEALASFQAEQFHQLIRRLTPQIKSIRFINDSTITNPKELSEQLKEFEQVDGRGFQWIPYNSLDLRMVLLLRSGKKQEIRLNVAREPDQLPEMLWERFYLDDAFPSHDPKRMKLKTLSQAALKQLFPQDAQTVFEHSDHLEILAINPDPFAASEQDNHTNDHSFHDCTVTKRVFITDPKQKTELIRAFYDGAARASILAACFNPHHGIRAVRGKQTVDLVICFSCGGVYCYFGDKKTFCGTSSVPYTLFEKILASGK